MKNRPLLDHVDYLQEELPKLGAKDLVAYSCSVIERQVCVYKKATGSEVWGDPDLFKKYLEICWGSLVEKSVFEKNFPEERFYDSQLAEGAAVYAEEVMFSLANTFDYVFFAGEDDFAIQASEASLNILDALCYDLMKLEVSSKNDLIVDTHELIKIEVQRQSRDFKYLLSNSYSSEWIEHVRSRNECLVGEQWFGDDY